MTTKRKKMRRGLKPPTTFTPEVIAAFRLMESARCTCPPIDWDGEYWKRPPPCEGCEQWWDNHNLLHRALRLPPWQWPQYKSPGDECPYPAGCYAANHWHRRRAENPERFELYAALQAAADKTA